MAVTYEPISTTTTAGSTALINFSSIPSTYTDLRVVICGTEYGTITRAEYWLNFNNDTGSNYSWQRVAGSNTTVSASAGTNTTYIVTGTTGSGTYPSIATMDIFGYAKTNIYKTVLSQNGASYGGASGSYAGLFIGTYRSTSAISSIQLTMGNGFDNTFNGGTIATLYGIQAA